MLPNRRANRIFRCRTRDWYPAAARWALSRLGPIAPRTAANGMLTNRILIALVSATSRFNPREPVSHA